VPDFIVELEFNSKILNDGTSMTVIWMNGQRVSVPAEDAGFTITAYGVMHEEAPLH